MTTAYSSVAGVELIVGACTSTTAKVGVTSLRAGTISVSGISGTVTVGDWTDLGGDNPAESGLHVCSSALVTISGLTPWTAYAGALSCDGVEIEFSFRTHPTDTSAYRFLMWSCERLVDDMYVGRGPFRSVKAEIQDSALPPVLFTACIDDPSYAYLVDNVTDSVSGLASTGQPEDTELEWDYAIGWLVWMGLIHDRTEVTHGTYAERLWVRHNCSHIVMWGDNEVTANHGRTANDKKIPRQAPWWSAAQDTYLRICADACSPTFLGEAADTGYGWAFTVGDANFVAPDINSFIVPFDAEDAGDTHEYGRTNHITHTAGTGATSPTRSQIHAHPYSPQTCFGMKQCRAIIDYFNDNPKAINVLFTPNGIEFENEPWHSRWPDEFDYLWASGQEFVLDGDFCEFDAHWTPRGEDTTLAGVHVDRDNQAGISITNGVAQSQHIYQQLSGLTAGQTYTLTGLRISGNCKIVVGATANGTDYLDQAITGSTFSHDFVPLVSNPYISLRVNSATMSAAAAYDKISVTGPGGNAGLLVSDQTNGTDGVLVVLKGDTHNCRVMRYVADGVDGLCNALLDGVEVWEINPGTITGSGSHRDATGQTIRGGGTVRFEQPMGGATGTQLVSTFAVCSVSGAELEVQLQNNYMGNKRPWRGTFAVGSNAPTYPRPKLAG